MHPRIFGVIKSYGLMLSLSFVLGIWLCTVRGRKRGIDRETVLDFSFMVMISSLIGVRLFYVLTHLDSFTPWYSMFYVWQGGLTLYGGIVLATLTVLYFCRRRGVPFLVMADIMAPAVVLGIGITRIGCFLNGCCFGKPTDSVLGVVFPETCAACLTTGGVPIHPTQLYSSALGFLVFITLLVWERFDRTVGATFARFLMFYGASRFLVDIFRYYEPGAVTSLGLTLSQLISLGLVACGLGLLIGLRRRRGT